MGLSGTNLIYRKQFSEGIWQNTETLASGLQVITSMDTAYAGSNNVVAYTTKSSNNLSTVNDLEVFYFDRTQTLRITNDDIPDNSVSFLNNELYWISGNSIVSITDGDLVSKTTVVENLGASVSESKAIKNSNGKKAVVWEEKNNSGMN